MREEEHVFQQSNRCHIREQLINNEDEKVRDHCHVTGKFRGAAHHSCNVNCQSTKKIPVTFHNLRDYDSHLIFSDLNKIDLKISVIPNGLEKYTAFFLGKNILFIDSMQFMSSSLDKLVKNLVEDDFKYLVKEFGHEYLEILKQKGERFNEEKLSARKYFFSSTKKGEIDNDGKISDGHLIYLMCEKIWKKSDMKNMGYYHDHY